MANLPAKRVSLKCFDNNIYPTNIYLFCVCFSFRKCNFSVSSAFPVVKRGATHDDSSAEPRRRSWFNKKAQSFDENASTVPTTLSSDTRRGSSSVDVITPDKDASNQLKLSGVLNVMKGVSCFSNSLPSKLLKLLLRKTTAVIKVVKEWILITWQNQTGQGLFEE